MGLQYSSLDENCLPAKGVYHLWSNPYNTQTPIFNTEVILHPGYEPSACGGLGRVTWTSIISTHIYLMMKQFTQHIYDTSELFVVGLQFQPGVTALFMKNQIENIFCKLLIWIL